MVGRELAPHLRPLSAAWFLARCDSHPPAASIATQAFNVAFPFTILRSNEGKSSDMSSRNKQREAVIFCAPEILGAIRCYPLV